MDGLNLAFQSAIGGIDIYQKQAYISSKNIERATEDGYSKLELQLTTDEFGRNRIASIDRVIDEHLEHNRMNAHANSAYTETKNYFAQRMQKLFGKPSSFEALKTDNIPENLSEAVNSFFNKLHILASSPESNTFKELVVHNAENLANMISRTATEIQQLKYQADQEIESCINTINHHLTVIDEINKNLKKTQNTTNIAHKADLEIKRDKALLSLSENLKIELLKQKDGSINISTDKGTLLLGDLKYTLKHSATPSYKNQNYEPIFISNSENPHIFSELDTNRIGIGKLQALLEIRDQDLTSVASRLDNLAHHLTIESNKSYANGTSFPGQSCITSEKKITLEQTSNFEGEIAIALLDKFGKAAKNDNEEIKPLILDLQNKTIKQIIKEINQYYHTNLHRVEFDDIYDIKLCSNNHDALTFNLIIDNGGNKEQNIIINGFTCSYLDKRDKETQTITTQNVQFLQNTIETTPGKLSNFEQKIKIDHNLIPTTIEELYIEVDVESNGFNAKIGYLIPISGIDTAYACNVNSTKAKLINNNTKQNLKASLVNDSGYKIDKPNSPGYLKIEANNTAEHSVAINNLNSKDINNKKSFLHEMGFSYIFTENDTIDGSALKFELNPKIKKEPYNFNSGQITKKNNSNIFETGISNGKGALELANIGDKTITFCEYGGIPLMNTNFSKYASKIIDKSALYAYETDLRSQIDKTCKESLEYQHDNISNVNVDDEIAKTILISNMHAASAKMLNTVNELSEEILKSI